MDGRKNDDIPPAVAVENYHMKHDKAKLGTRECGVHTAVLLYACDLYCNLPTAVFIQRYARHCPWDRPLPLMNYKHDPCQCAVYVCLSFVWVWVVFILLKTIRVSQHHLPPSNILTSLTEVDVFRGHTPTTQRAHKPNIQKKIKGPRIKYQENYRIHKNRHRRYPTNKRTNTMEMAPSRCSSHTSLVVIYRV